MTRALPDSFNFRQKDPSFMRSMEYELFLKWAASEPFTKKGKSIARLAGELNRSRDTIHRWINHPLTPVKMKEYLGKLTVTKMVQLFYNILGGEKIDNHMAIMLYLKMFNHRDAKENDTSAILTVINKCFDE
jgi:hypothetical protein